MPTLTREWVEERLEIYKNIDDPFVVALCRSWLANHDGTGGWISVDDEKPKCSKVPNSFGVPVLIYPPYKSEGTSETHQVYYGCRQSDKPNFYIYGKVIYPTHWQPLQPPPKDTVLNRFQTGD